MNDGVNPKNMDKNCIFLKIAMEKCLLKSNSYIRQDKNTYLFNSLFTKPVIH